MQIMIILFGLTKIRNEMGSQNHIGLYKTKISLQKDHLIDYPNR